MIASSTVPLLAPLLLGSPGPLLPPAVSIVMAAGTGLSVVWIVSEVGRRAAVRGSRPRYLYATAERALRFPVLLYFVAAAVIEIRWYQDWLLFLVDCMAVALWISLWLEKRGGEDDDFWTGFSKKVRSLLGRYSPAAAPEGA